MRSVSALVALAFAGSFELAAASACKPSSSAQGDKTTESSPVPSGTTTKSVPASSTTEGPIIITNAVTNGDFGGYDPSADGGIYAFQAGGDAKLLQGSGYQGDHTEERNCVQLKTSSGNVKRDFASENPWIQQKLDEMEPSDYTVRFWYTIISNAVADTCRIEGYYGGDQFGVTPYFPVTSNAAGDNWLEFIDSMPVTTTSGMVRFELVCVNGGSAEAYFDQVFVSNKVGEEWVDGISLFFPTSKHAATIPPAQTSTALPVDTAVTSSDNTESSDLPTTQPSEAPTTTDEASAAGETTGSAPTTASTSAPTDAVTPSGKKVCAKLGAGAAGRGCAKRPYSSKQGYKRYGGSSITKEQCAALCLVDDKCQSFEWLYQGSGCANTCQLLASNWDDAPTNGGSDAAWAYDRTCIQEDECSELPAGSVCVNVNADTPAKSCTTVMGKAKTCAKPFLTVSTKAYCGLSNECRDLCAKYPSCKSYAASYGSCSLYNARSSEVAEAGSQLTWFTDMDCHACGEGNAYFNYIPLGQDPADMPEWTCAAQPQKTTSSLVVSTTAKPAVKTTSSLETTSSLSETNNDSPTSTIEPTVTTAPPSTTTKICPNGVPSPGICSSANPVPSRALCGKHGWPQYVDPYGVGLDDFPHQSSVEDCALICKQDRGCKAFAFDANQPRLKCMFSPLQLDEAIIVEDSSSSVVWSDLKCMSCKLCGEADSPTTTQPASPPELTCTVVDNNQGCRYKDADEWPIGSNGRAIAGYSCQGNGKVTDGEPFSADINAWPRQGSMEQCTGTCMQLENCKSSAWNRDTGRCEFFSTSLQVAGYRPLAGSNVFYNDNACYDCSGLCKHPVFEGTTESVPFFPQSTEAPTTMVTSTRPADNDQHEPSTTEAATGVSTSAEHDTERPTTTAKAPQAEPTDCAVPSASLSDDVTCGLPGSSGQQAQSTRLDNYVIKPVGSLAKCAAICLQRADCQGFDYQKDTTVCYPYRVGPAGLGITYNPKSTDRFYDRDCFKCAS
ncbi:hypothetical protein ACHAPJ_006870 [Fusarium lateritium]